MNDTTAQREAPSTLKLILSMGALVVLGTPLVYVLWTALNDVLAGRIDGGRLLLTLPILLLFLGLLYYVARVVRRWQGA